MDGLSMEERARFILNTYIEIGGIREINISSGMRHKVLQAPYSTQMFDDVYEEVKGNFLRDSFTRFLKRLGQTESGALVPGNRMSELGPASRVSQLGASIG